MTSQSFKIDHNLETFEVIDLGTLEVVSPDQMDELPKVDIAAHNEINYPSFENALTGDKEL